MGGGVISVFELFRIGIGPSSPPTVGPVVAARRFLKTKPVRIRRVRGELFGSLARRGDVTHHVSLDQVIETMRQKSAGMQSKYRETGQSGLAVNLFAS
ncbi:MAG: hypothetical protein B7Y12_20110 [Rhizobiales bacterium 24-66-13]|jgi:L-serine dehydratase|nr:MAG: hypothetical protein B7Y61_03935 [Rhizobiales bacterium 35-66-30]OYZ68782.1 MAG: hypothetical protein B7Y12_20110 [Rhizobiales bacterium 24-66-13]OZB09626.1 MAG: hypothetical protein B7X67_06865 [Rhizobiales bacterium 39-66-18]HQS09561.1 serine dehydratase beta chain [Xanthobacteraceae bacterium]HQS46879.1 serine dehydratase beta chain [Xanthobacteraceae bacterium]